MLKLKLNKDVKLNPSPHMRIWLGYLTLKCLGRQDWPGCHCFQCSAGSLTFTTIQILPIIVKLLSSLLPKVEISSTTSLHFSLLFFFSFFFFWLINEINDSEKCKVIIKCDLKCRQKTREEKPWWTYKL